MKLAISSDGPGLEATVDPRFGRCPYLVIVETETMELRPLENVNAGAAGGAGITTAQMIAKEGVRVVLTGNCGPNAYQTLEAAGIQVITGISGTVKDAVDAYKSGQLQGTQQANVPSHFGIGGGMGTGRGMGRGGGRGSGRGMGRGMGRLNVSASPGGVPSPTEDWAGLTEQLRVLSLQIEQLKKSIERLERRET